MCKHIVNDAALKLLSYERDKFIHDTKIKNKNMSDLSLKNKDDYYYGMEKAFDDAFNQYARREKKKYADKKQVLMTPVVERLHKYFNDNSDGFDTCFTKCIDLSMEILDNNKYGVAQKFTNMSFKYLYCYGDALDFENKFKDCHMPLDKYTIKWVKSLKDNDINRRLGSINNAWANIDKSLYEDIQTLITRTLEDKYTYTISFNKQAKETTCTIPKNKLYAEFIIWHQEKINELYKAIKKAKPDFERLGIKWM